MGSPNFGRKGSITSEYYGFDWRLSDYLTSDNPDEEELINAQIDCQDDAEYYIEKAESLVDYIHDDFGEVVMESKLFDCYVKPVAHLDYGYHSGVRFLVEFSVEVNNEPIEVPLDRHDNYDNSDLKSDILEEIDWQTDQRFTQKQLHNYYGKIVDHVDNVVETLQQQLDKFLVQHCTHIHGTGWCGTSELI